MTGVLIRRNRFGTENCHTPALEILLQGSGRVGDVTGLEAAQRRLAAMVKPRTGLDDVRVTAQGCGSPCLGFRTVAESIKRQKNRKATVVWHDGERLVLCLSTIEHLKAKGMNQAQIADLFGASRQAVSQAVQQILVRLKNVNRGGWLLQ